ncbi:MAG TPA: hypothetical protein ENI20_03520 [Bacteroides sp.]|nr:hypothetical protein [Bacteroides sp.]
MNPFSMLAFIILATITFSGCKPAEKPSSTERPNIIIIMADDLGFSDPGCFGCEIQTLKKFETML